jgi:hypothetical protein
LRIRTIKPEFTQDEELSSLSAECHVLAGGLLCYADDDGYFNANPGLVKAAVFPVRETSVSIPVMLQELSRIEYVKFGTAPDGKRYGLIRNFTKHQVINHKRDSVIKKLQLVWDDSGNTPVALPDDSLQPHQPAREEGSTPPVTLRPEGKGREWKGMEGEAEERPRTDQHPAEIITPDQTALPEPAGGLHPNQYATRLLEEIRFPVVPQNIRAVAAAIECESRSMGMVAAFEFVLECTKFAIFEEHEINSFFFTDGKYRPERRNNTNARQVSAAAQRTNNTRRALIEAVTKRAAEADRRDSAKRQNGAQ